MNDYYNPADEIEAVTRARSAAINALNNAVDAAFDIVPDLDGLESAVTSANFAGIWADLTGAAAVNISVYHLNQFWRLTTALADIATKVPGTDSEWVRDKNRVAKNLGTLTGGTVDLDLNLADMFYGTITTAETTFTFSNFAPTGTHNIFELKLTNPGNQVLNFPATVTWAVDAPIPTAVGQDTFIFESIDGGVTLVDGYISAQVV